MKRAADKEAAAKRRAIELEFAAAVPQKLVREWSGWQTKVLHDVEARYGCPVARPTVDLAEVFRWIRQLLKKHGPTIRAENEPEPLLDQIRAERLHRERLLRKATERSLCDVAEVRAQLDRLAALLRGALARAHRAGSVDEAVSEWTEALTQFEAEVRDL